MGAAFKSAPKTEFNKAEVNKAEVAPKTEAGATLSARVVVGMGLNVTLTREQLPIEKATSLALEGRDTDRTELAIALLKNLRRRITQWENQDPQLMADYRKVCSTIGQEVRLEAPTGDVVGVVESIADDGRINVGGEYYPPTTSRTCARSSSDSLRAAWRGGALKHNLPNRARRRAW